ncbi:MAG: methyltransferase domain-containing protein [Alphaproteobacteria bacterium]|nr:methyltransferase domain-containing protein [Alphaproteobacteria bacterium]
MSALEVEDLPEDGFPSGFSPGFSTERADTFEARFVDMLNGGALALMVSIGHRTGLFDALADGQWVTSEALAVRAGLDERYVREWLGAMTTGRIVECDGAAGTFRLPAEHAACLTRAATPNNLAVFAQYVGELGSVESDIVACFRNGGGVPYSRYKRFHEIMAEDSGQSVLPALEEHILPLVPGLIERLEAGIRVLDLGCGRGRALMQLAARFPASTFTGYDLSDEALAWASAEAEERGLANVRFAVRDLSGFDRDADPAAFDFVTTFDAVHDQADPRALVRGIRRTLAPGGVYLAQDINGSSHTHENVDHPIGPLLYTISCMHCMTVSLAQEGGAGLGAMWGHQTAVGMFTEAGFGSVEVNELAHDVQNLYYVCRP